MNTNHGLRVWSDFRREFDRLFDDWTPATERNWRSDSQLVPACDVEEVADHYLLTLEMPGVSKDDIKIEIADQQISISAERRPDTRKDEQSLAYTERRFGKFHRSFTLPSGIDPDRVEAVYQDGILRVVISKSEAAKPRQIKISSGANSGFFGKLIGQPKETTKEGHVA